jgi:hypothetical protein
MLSPAEFKSIEVSPISKQDRPMFVGSYPPVTPVGEVGPYFVNTYYLQTDRILELPGPIPVRSSST